MPESKHDPWLPGLFWIVAVITALLVLVPTWNDWNHPSGEFAGLVILAELLIGSFVAIVIVVVAAFRKPVAYWIGLAMLAMPALFFGIGFANRLIFLVNAPSETEYRAYREAREAGHGYFSSNPDRALADAIVVGDAAKVALLAPAANLHVVGESNMTFMELALENGRANLDVVAALLKAGADPDQDYGKLFGPIETGKDQNNAMDGLFLRMAIESGVDMNHENREGRPRFFGPLCWSKPDTIAFMLEHGVDIEAEDKYGDTVIAWLVKWCSGGHTDILLARGARTDHVNRDGKSLRDIVLAEYESRRVYNTNSPEMTALEARFH